jgi:hypothetical protein
MFYSFFLLSLRSHSLQFSSYTLNPFVCTSSIASNVARVALNKYNRESEKMIILVARMCVQLSAKMNEKLHTKEGRHNGSMMTKKGGEREQEEQSLPKQSV